MPTIPVFDIVIPLSLRLHLFILSPYDLHIRLLYYGP